MSSATDVATITLFRNAAGKRSTDFGRYVTCSKMGPRLAPPERMSWKLASVGWRGSSERRSDWSDFSDWSAPSTTGRSGSSRNAITATFASVSSACRVGEERSRAPAAGPTMRT